MEGATIKMSRKSLKILLVLVTILSLISTFSLATDDTNSAEATSSNDEAVVTSDESGTAAISDENSAENGETASDGTNKTTSSTEASTNHDVYLSGDSITIGSGETVNGNAFVCAKTVTINGQIGGDLFVIADTLNIDGGQIYGNVFALSQSITLNGLIYDLYAACGTLTMGYDGVAYRDLKVNCDNATINGVVGKNINISAKTSLSLDSDCIVYGDLNYSTASEITIADGLVKGTVNFDKLAPTASDGILGYVMAGLTLLVYVLVIWLLMSKLAPKFYDKVTKMPVKKLLLSILVGLVAMIVVPLVSIALFFTVIGIPVAFALIAVFAIILAISFATVSINLANMLASKVKVLAKFNNLFAVIIVTIVLWLITLIPYVGPIVNMLLVLCGFGMVLANIISKNKKSVETAQV